MAEKKEQPGAAPEVKTAAEPEPDIGGLVDGKTLTGEAYLAAAEKAGYDRNFLIANPERRPASISTKRHGE